MTAPATQLVYWTGSALRARPFALDDSHSDDPPPWAH